MSVMVGKRKMKTKADERKKTPNPGSPEAVKQGCRCPVLDNAHGRGAGWGENTFWINAGCGLHAAQKNGTKEKKNVVST